jgi:hypothetical protein
MVILLRLLVVLVVSALGATPLVMKMKIEELPLSENVEDRRHELPTNRPRYTLRELLERGSFQPIPDSSLAKDAGIEYVLPQK